LRREIDVTSRPSERERPNHSIPLALVSWFDPNS
jgi:hypothetical protein